MRQRSARAPGYCGFGFDFCSWRSSLAHKRDTVTDRACIALLLFCCCHGGEDNQTQTIPSQCCGTMALFFCVEGSVVVVAGGIVLVH